MPDMAQRTAAGPSCIIEEGLQLELQQAAYARHIAEAAHVRACRSEVATRAAAVAAYEAWRRAEQAVFEAFTVHLEERARG